MGLKRESKIISGSDVQQTSEKRTWRCTVQTGSGDIVTIPFEVVLKLLADYNIEVVKYGDHYQACAVTK